MSHRKKTKLTKSEFDRVIRENLNSEKRITNAYDLSVNGGLNGTKFSSQESTIRFLNFD